MNFFDDLANLNLPGGWAEPLLLQLRARRQRARDVLARQAELLAQLESAIAASGSPANESAQLRTWLNDFSEQQMIWQQRQDDNWQRQLSMLDTLAEQLDEFSATLHGDRPEASKPAAAPPVAPASNWEQAKQRLLAELENATDGNAEEKEKEKTELAGSKSRRPWQQIVAEKEAEIAQLRRQLEEQALMTPAVVLPEAVETDELIRLERENLRRLQAEWQEKLRLAEIEISLERAKLARERQQLEEKLQNTSRDSVAPVSTTQPIDDNKAPRSRWMARLGLLDE